MPFLVKPDTTQLNTCNSIFYNFLRQVNTAIFRGDRETLMKYLLTFGGYTPNCDQV